MARLNTINTEKPPSEPKNAQDISTQQAKPYYQYVFIFIFLWFLLGLLYNLIFPTTVPSCTCNSPPTFFDDSTIPHHRYNPVSGRVTCRPSTGGIWIKVLGAVELQHLNIDRFQTTDHSSNQTEEDLFCHEFLKFGPSWWEIPVTVDHSCREFECLSPTVWVRWESCLTEDGGAWILHDVNTMELLHSRELLNNALTMQERCAVLERLGAGFCETVHACPEMRALLGR